MNGESTEKNFFLSLILNVQIEKLELHCGKKKNFLLERRTL
jgi:hypothetical protein